MSYSSGSTKSPSRTATATPCSDLVAGLPQANTSDYGSSDGSHVQQCVRCLHYGHDRCRRRPRCFRCGAFDHTDSSSCVKPVVCLNCGGPHHSKHAGCPSRLRELTIQQLVHKQGLSRKEAVQIAASFGVDTSRLKSVAVQTDPPPADVATQTDFANHYPESTARQIAPTTGGCSGFSNHGCSGTNNNHHHHGNNNNNNNNSSCHSNNNNSSGFNNSNSNNNSCTSTSCAHDADIWKLSLYQTLPPPPQMLGCWSTSYPTASYPFYGPVQIVSYPASASLASQVHWNCDQTTTTTTNEYYTSY